MTAPIRQWCNDSRMLREEFAEATIAANRLCDAVPAEVDDALLVILNEIQHELEDLPIDQRLIDPLVKELNYLIDQLDQLHRFRFPTQAQWEQMAAAKGFRELSQAEVGAFNQEFTSPPSEYLWRGLWQKDNGPVFGIWRSPWGQQVGVLLAEAPTVRGGMINRPVAIYDFTPGQQTFRDLFDRPFEADVHDQTYFTDATPFYRNPIPTSSMVAEILNFLDTGKLSWRRPRNPSYEDRYKLKEEGGIRSWIRSQRLPAFGNAPAGMRSEFERRQATLGSGAEEWVPMTRVRPRSEYEDLSDSQTSEFE